MTKLLLILMVVVGFSGCVNIKRDQVRQTKAPQPPNITQIISDPLGAKIEINHEYVGETPISIQIRALTSWLSGKVVEDLIIVAHPVDSGQYTQSKNLKGVKIPSKIYFNLSLKPLPDEEINVNINR